MTMLHTFSNIVGLESVFFLQDHITSLARCRNLCCKRPRQIRLTPLFLKLVTSVTIGIALTTSVSLHCKEQGVDIMMGSDLHVMSDKAYRRMGATSTLLFLVRSGWSQCQLFPLVVSHFLSVMMAKRSYPSYTTCTLLLSGRTSLER